MKLPVWMGGALAGAEFSGDRRFRYVLWRVWDTALPLLGVVMLNPSSAGGEADDATIRVVTGRARREGYGGFVVGNLYAFIATDPADMNRARREGEDVVGPANDATLSRISAAVGRVWCAWGAPAEPERAAAVLRLLDPLPLVVVGLTRHGRPRHPLRVPNEAPFLVLHP